MKNKILHFNDLIYLTCIWTSGISVLVMSLIVPVGHFYPLCAGHWLALARTCGGDADGGVHFFWRLGGLPRPGATLRSPW